jgi:PiT family inorganic phosphate transporter
VRWGVAGDVAIAWVITIPASAIVAALFYCLISAMFVPVVIAVVIIAAVLLAVRAWRLQARAQ